MVLGNRYLGVDIRAEVPLLADPGLLLADDLHDVGADQDGVRGTVDLGLLVAQPGDHPALGNRGGIQAGYLAERLKSIISTSLARRPVSAWISQARITAG